MQRLVNILLYRCLTVQWCDDYNTILGKQTSPMYNSQSVQNVIVKIGSIFYHNLYVIAEE